MTSWQHYHGQGKQCFIQEAYSEALVFYREAIALAQNRAPRGEQAIILSNIVACRLKIGGVDLTAAVDEAKECIVLNDKWPKGYLRLASVYIALGGHSNDACRALQTAIRLDPSNSQARAMLTKELRRDHVQHSNHNYTAEDISANDADAGNLDSDEGRRSSMVPDVDDTEGDPTWTRWIHDTWYHLQEWYANSSDNTKLLIQVFIGLLILYVAFGGRFGFGTTTASYRHGNYEGNNAYERFYNNDSRGDSRSGRRASSTDYQYQDSVNDRPQNQNNNGYHRNNYGMEYNMSVLIPIVVIFILQKLGVPVPMGFGRRRGLGFGRRMGFGGGGIGFGHVNIGGFRFPIPPNGFRGR